MPERRRLSIEGRAVKVADSVKVVEVAYKAKKLIRVRAEFLGDQILTLQFSGGFFMIPEDALLDLEERLNGVKLDHQEITDRLRDFYRNVDVETPGITADDFSDAVIKLKDLAEIYQPAVYPYKKERN